MKRVFNSLLLLVMATATMGLAVTQARADRVSFVGCQGVPCITNTLTLGRASLSLGASSLSLEVPESDIYQLEVMPSRWNSAAMDVASTGGAQTATSGSTVSLKTTRKSGPTNSELALLSNSSLWSLNGSYPAMNVTQSATALFLRSGITGSGSFSVVTPSLVSTPNMNSTNAASAKRADGSLQANGAEPEPKLVGAPAVPEPTTMLLFGTGLVGAAAVLRKRLKGRQKK